MRLPPPGCRAYIQIGIGEVAVRGDAEFLRRYRAKRASGAPNRRSTLAMDRFQPGTLAVRQPRRPATARTDFSRSWSSPCNQPSSGRTPFRRAQAFDRRRRYRAVAP
jgi:hypothetical protein